MLDDMGERIENSTSATLGVHLTYGLAMASDHPHIWSGVNSPVFTIYKVISLKCLICFLLLVDETMIFSKLPLSVIRLSKKTDDYEIVESNSFKLVSLVF
ncbi:unnamed protein product, partial [Vitis vinifera]|uniref:Uncharacterized protein n=1 Tax=Vitis vinifera TaxID=29760 RepID=D7UB52_VITVI